MDDEIQRALDSERTVDITTMGRKSGVARRIEVWFHNVDDRIYVTGTPGSRDWYANLLAQPSLTFHLKQSVTADLPATAHVITDQDERRKLLAEITGRLGAADKLETWVQKSPLIEVQFAS